MLGVPGTSFLRAVPGSGQGADRRKVSTTRLGIPGSVKAQVIAVRQTLEVLERVVPGVLISVVDVMAWRNRAVGGLPDLSVQALDTSLAGGDPWNEVSPVRL